MARRPRGRPIHGWLVIDKPAGMTSAHVVAVVKRLMDARKAGHGGTLDPGATGVLPIALGEATKCMAFVVDGTKTYRFTVCWGQETETDDAEGAVTETAPGRPTGPEIEPALARFRGDVSQRPPAYSALKVAGRRAYALARGGAPAVLAARAVRVDRLALIGCPDPDHADLELTCGKGFYVRSLARDLGRHLGTRGHLAALRRLRVGPFTAEQAISLDKLKDLCDTPAAPQPLLPVQTALADIPALAVTGAQAERLRSGQAVKALNARDGLVCVMSGQDPVALAQVDDGTVRPVRVFNL